MFALNEDLSIYATRGDIVFFSVTAEDKETKEVLTFKASDMVRIKVFGKKNVENVVLQKDFPVLSECTEVEIYLDKEDTKIGDVISKPKDYWYEVELNPLNNPQTLIGYDEDGPKVFKLFPEGAEVPEFVPTPEDIPFIDDELDLTSPRPVENQAVARAVTRLKGEIEKTNEAAKKNTENVSKSFSFVTNEIAVERARVDQMAAGTTPSGSEVVDIRVGANGVTYGSAGTAVREQFAAVNKSLENYVRLESTNLVNKDNFTYGKYVDYTTGNLVTDDVSACTELIEIKPDTNYTYSMHASNRAVGQLAYYNAAGAYISGVSNSGVKNYITLATPKNAKFVRWTIPVGYVDMASIVEGAVVVPYEDYYPCIPDKYLEKFVEVGTGCEFTSILRALKKTSDDTTIYIRPGVYNIVHEYRDYYGEDFFDNYTGYSGVSDKFYRGLWLGKGRKVIGVSNVELVFDYADDNAAVHEYFSVIANDVNVLLENVTIKVYENCRYHIHDDFQPQNGSVTFRNLVLDGKPYTPVFIGGGVGKNVTYLLEHIVFLGDEEATYDISYHGNTTADTDVSCKIDVTNCCGASGCAFRWYGASEKVTLCTVSDSKFSKIECVAYDENQTNENMKLIAWSYKGDPGDTFDAPPILCDATGNVIAVNDSAERPLHGLTLYGKSIQNGTPTPENPVEIVSPGAGGTITVTIEGAEEQTLTAQTPNGLPGIPVSSGGNYTDENGQMWICDEIDFARGKYVQRVYEFDVYNANIQDAGDISVNAKDYYGFFNIVNLGFPKAVAHGFCTHFRMSEKVINAGYNSAGLGAFWINETLCRFSMPHAYLGTTSENTRVECAQALQRWFNGQKEAGTPVTIQYVLAAPIETDLTAEEIAQYTALHTNYPNTTIFNEGADMAVKYVVDTKMYIDKKFAELAALLNA